MPRPTAPVPWNRRERTPRLTALVAALGLVMVAATAAPSNVAQGAPPRIGQPVPKPAAPPLPARGQVQTLEWEELLPENERDDFFAGPPPPIHDYLAGELSLAAQQPMNFTVNDELNGRAVRLPGFIVPLELNDAGKVIEFFLVPYFGACIHVPPPPPNQMVFVTVSQGIVLDSMYSAYWVTGQMSTRTRQTRLGAAAYTLAASDLEEYRY